jgi:PPM family protein phosphatase
MLKQTGVGSAIMPNYELVASLQTDKGCVREANEDSGRYINPSEATLRASRGTLMIVADGMGGHASGEVASGMAVELVSRLYYEAAGDAQAALKHAVAEANRLIHEASLEDEKLRGMGTTCTVLVLQQGFAYSIHVGDSRIYLFRDGQLYLMTEDHSAVMELVKQGVITQSEARHHADKNVILRALGTSPEVRATMWEQPLPLRAGDRFLLCSDGLYDLVEDKEIEQTLATNADPYEICQQLIARAKERGGHDNITIGIINVQLPTENNQDEQTLRATRELEVVR